ncbi:MAG: Bax inhibitor-1/YccA family protein [Bacteroidetes bacterium]|nr:Bax inhibitor-1/YccA family protein [Bacteroidota bacterium]
MENNEIQYTKAVDETAEVAKIFLAKVFTWMAVALGISAFTAYIFGTTSLINYLVSETGMTAFGWIVMFAPLAFVFGMSLGYNKLSLPAMIGLFIAYSVLTGMSLSFIFIIYQMGSVISTFGVAAAVFGIMAVAGYTTKTDLTSFGKLMMFGLIGIILASIINAFMGSSTMSYVISFIGVIVFMGLTAYDMQKLKRIGAGIEFDEQGSASVGKLAIFGALNLYLDFLNIFLYLLRLFGNRR